MASGLHAPASDRRPGDPVRRIALFAVAWAVLFTLADVGLLGTRFDHYLASGQRAVAVAAFALNLLLFSWLVLAVAVPVGRARSAFLLVAALYLVLALASRLKLANLGEPLLPWDYLAIRQFAGMSTGYLALDGISGAILAMAVAALAAAATLFKRDPPIARTKAFVAALLLGVPLYVLYLVVEPARKPLGLLNLAWAQAHNLRTQGLLNHFALNLRPALIVPPPGYSEAAIRAACASNRDAPAVPSQLPSARSPRHVIVVLNEAFTRIDRTLSPEVAFSAELAPYFGSLAPVPLSVPAFGGLTANTEFEILSGTPMAFLPTGAIPFQHYLREPQPNALPQLFRRAGYRAIALHPFDRRFWNRDQAFRLLGFERFVAIDELGMPPGPPYVRDAALVAPIVDLVSASPQPLFLFVTTMENHGPWFDRRYGTPDVTVRGAPADWSAKAREAVATYAQGVMHGDAFLRSLAARFAGRDDVVIAMFGDHHPTIVVPDMGNRNLMALRFGEPSERLPPAFADRRMLETEIAFWPRSLSLPAGAQATLLGPALARAAGVPLDGYWRTIERVGERHPAVQKRFVTTADGKALPASDAPGTDVLRLLQYDALFGARHAAVHCTGSD